MDFYPDCDNQVLNISAISNIKRDFMSKESSESCFILAM
jgi:hypothetical protein